MWRMMLNSSAMPLPPSMPRASRAMFSASRTLFIFPTEICSGRTTPCSFSRPRWSASSCAFEISQTMPANLRCDSWNAASGLPNCSRCSWYSSADSKHARAEPMTPQTMP